MDRSGTPAARGFRSTAMRQEFGSGSASLSEYWRVTPATPMSMCAPGSHVGNCPPSGCTSRSETTPDASVIRSETRSCTKSAGAVEGAGVKFCTGGGSLLAFCEICDVFMWEARRGVRAGQGCRASECGGGQTTSVMRRPRWRSYSR